MAVVQGNLRIMANQDKTIYFIEERRLESLAAAKTDIKNVWAIPQ